LQGGVAMGMISIPVQVSSVDPLRIFYFDERS